MLNIYIGSDANNEVGLIYHRLGLIWRERSVGVVISISHDDGVHVLLTPQNWCNPCGLLALLDPVIGMRWEV